MSGQLKTQYSVGQHVRGKGIYFGTAEIISGLNFNMYADFNDVTVQDLMKTRRSKEAVGPRDEKFLLNTFRNAVHALGNAALPDIEQIKDRSSDRPNISYKQDLMKRLSTYKSGDISGRFIPTAEMLIGIDDQEGGRMGNFNTLKTTWKNHAGENEYGVAPYHTCTEVAGDSMPDRQIQETMGFYFQRHNEPSRLVYLNKNNSVARLRLVRVECV